MGRIKEYIKKIRKDQCVILILFGILLFVIVIPTNDSAKSSLKDKETSTIKEQDSNEQEGKTITDLEFYTAYLEKRLKGVLEDVEQVGRVQVMITMESSTEKVVEKDQPVSRSNTQELDAQGGNRMLNQTESGESTVYSTENGSSEPYIVKTIQPKVEGVMVVAEGAGTGNVSKNITEVIQVLFGIEAHKIKVVKMKTS